MKFFKTTILGITILMVSQYAQATGDYKAKLAEGLLITTNGKYTYVVDPSALRETIATEGDVLVKIYGTEIYVLLDKAGSTRVRNSQLQGKRYYVLAPMKDMDSKDVSVDYKKFAIGYPRSNALTYPTEFCSSCAAPTKVDKKISAELKEIMAGFDLQVSNTNPAEGHLNF